MGILLKEGHGPLTDKGIWKYILTNKAVFLNKDLGGSFLQMNQIPTNYFWKITFLCSFFLVPRPCSAVLCCAAKTGSFQPRTTRLEQFQLQQIPAAGQPLGRGQSSVSTSQILLRLSKH